MEDFRRCLGRQERETNERNRRADEINELQREVDEQVVIACDAAGILGLLPEQKLTAVI
ncbi:unnamed protein product [Prunus brigantina]